MNINSSQCGIGLKIEETTHAVAPELGLHVNVVYDLRSEDLAVPEDRSSW